MKRRFQAAWLALSLAGSLAAPAAFASEHIVYMQWSAEGRFEYRGQVAPGKILELCDKLRSGQTIKWQFDTGAVADFNIHFHKGKETVYPAKLSQVRQGADTLRVDSDETHCWMWRNKGDAPLSVTANLQR